MNMHLTVRDSDKHRSTLKKGIIGVAGEYFVAAELSQRGIVATLTLKNTPSIDVIATNLENGKVANIQVKTMAIDNKSGWRLSDKNEQPSSIRNHYFVLVNLGGPGALPEYYIIPQPKLAKYLHDDYREWLHGAKKVDTRHDTPMRIFDPYRRAKPREWGAKYKNNWDILSLW